MVTLTAPDDAGVATSTSKSITISKATYRKVSTKTEVR
ncbi:hypothetical protein OK016_27195 [Vibrio chagasii]|nr:hypothetical protein [Vibrio chagasii]